MSLELVVFIAALIVSVLVFAWLIKVVKATIKTALLIAAIVLLLQLVFGIGPNQLWQQILELVQQVSPVPITR